VVAVVDTASRHATVSVAGVQHGCPPIRSRCPRSGCPAVPCPVPWAGRPERPAVARLLSTRAVSSRLVSGPRPSGRVRLLPAQAVALGTQVEKAGTRATPPKSRWSVGGWWWTRAAGFGAGRGDRACPLSDQAGRAGGGAPVAGGCAVGTGAGGSARRLHPPPGWRPRLGARPRWVVVAEPAVRGGRSRRGPGRCQWGWACGPSAAQAGGERAWLAAGSALTCDDGVWACQDLNLGPHPYQAHSRDAFMLEERDAARSAAVWQ
jgi:hypothetical protein